MNKQILSIFCFLCFSYSTQAQEVKGGISDSMMQQIKQSYANTPTDKAIRNAIGNNDIRKLALNQDNRKAWIRIFLSKCLLKVSPTKNLLVVAGFYRFECDACQSDRQA